MVKPTITLLLALAALNAGVLSVPMTGDGLSSNSTTSSSQIQSSAGYSSNETSTVVNTTSTVHENVTTTSISNTTKTSDAMTTTKPTGENTSTYTTKPNTSYDTYSTSVASNTSYLTYPSSSVPNTSYNTYPTSSVPNTSYNSSGPNTSYNTYPTTTYNPNTSYNTYPTQSSDMNSTMYNNYTSKSDGLSSTYHNNYTTTKIDGTSSNYNNYTTKTDGTSTNYNNVTTMLSDHDVSTSNSESTTRVSETVSTSKSESTTRVSESVTTKSVEGSSTTKHETTTKPTASSTSHDSVPTEISDDKTSVVNRTLSVFMNDEGTKLVVSVKSQNESVKYRGDFSLNTENGPEAGARFVVQENNDTDAFGFRVALLRLVELNPSHNWTLRSSNNSINFLKNGRFWSPINVTEVPNERNVTVKKVSTVFSMPVNGSDKNVSVTFEAFLVNQPVSIDNHTYLPRALKYGLVIENFPFQFNDSSLAVVKGAIFRTTEKNEFSSENRTFVIGDGKGRFNWTNEVTYDGEPGVIYANGSSVSSSSEVTTENATIDASESLIRLVFRTQPGNFSRIEWDPEVILEEDKLAQSLYVQSKSAAGATTVSVGVSLVALLFSFFVNYF